ncbi:diguanylate cyclase [Acidovorax sp. SRB_14]|uniref:GGDEF domain-containing protein n=1 Tax=Acidovorax sp. SRB_14 TaxID=1962699 RepID=UPI0015650445|nr:GGDEF domain-containing protein [Acidovorax sp. SRB_14]NMM79525.1 diguanylate cyclase [Acidovorax sp. SRB_14]
MHRLLSTNLADLLLDAVCIVDVESRIVFVSAAFERIFGYTPEEAVGLRMFDLVHPHDRELTRQEAQRVTDGGLQLGFENRYVRKDGRIAHIRWTARWVETEQVRVAVAHDVTERKHTEALQAAVYAISEAAHTAEDLLALFERIHQTLGGLLAAQNFAVALYDAERDELSFPYHVNERHAAPPPLPLGADALCAQVIRSGQTLLVTPETAGAAEAAAAAAPYWLGVPLATQRGAIGALVLQGYGEDARYTEKDRDLLQFVSAQIAFAIERKQMHARLQHMAQFDQLTELPNRQLFLDRLRTALARARRDHTRLSLLFLDLDHFKQVNDTLGHAAGDLLLQQVAQRLLGCVRSSDTVARLGGDEFVVLLESGQSSGHADSVAQKILAAFAAPFTLPGQRVAIVPSIGVAVYPDHGSEATTLLAHADAAMYQCKRNGAPAAWRAASAPAPHPSCHGGASTTA